MDRVGELLERWYAISSPGWARRSAQPARYSTASSCLTSAQSWSASEWQYRRSAPGGGDDQRVHVVLRSALGRAMRWGWIRDNPAERAHRIPSVSREPDPPTPTELDTLLDHLQSTHPALYTFVILAATTGARRAQLLGLRWRNVNLTDGQVAFTNGWVEGPFGPVLTDTKTKRRHTVELYGATTGVHAEHTRRITAIVGGLDRDGVRVHQRRQGSAGVEAELGDQSLPPRCSRCWAASIPAPRSQPTSIARHERLQRWSVDVLARRAERLLGLRLEIDPDSAAALIPGPVVVLCRHVSIVDASLPTLLYQRLGYRTRGVIMAELLADPGFDLIYTRTGSVFIPRDNGPEAIAMVRGLGQSVDSTTAVVIFPEGRLFRPDHLERAKARLALENPERATRLDSLRHVMPLALTGSSRSST
jgi:Acyltransferase